MHRIILAGLVCLAGCQNVVGPFQARQPQRVDDPCLPIYEQQRRGRDRLALPEQNFGQNYGDAPVAPPTFIDRPGVHGR